MKQIMLFVFLICSSLPCMASEVAAQAKQPHLTPEEKCIYATVHVQVCKKCNQEKCQHCNAIKSLEQNHVPSNERMHSDNPTVLEFDAYEWALGEPYSETKTSLYCRAYINWYEKQFCN